MAYLVPLRLEASAANTLTRTLIQGFEQRLRVILLAVSKKDLLIISNSSLNTHELEEEVLASHLEGCHTFNNAVTATLELIGSVCSVWYNIPGIRSVIGRRLENCMDINTEVNPRCDQDFAQHLGSIFLKLNLLNEVFIDRDYSDKDLQCVIPYVWKNFVRRVVCKTSPLSVTKLQVYGGMYPTIIESMVYSAPYITSISLSHLNITDDLILALSYSCPCLQQLYLMHCFPCRVISMSVFCSTFFCGSSEQEVIDSMQPECENQINITFKHLSELELCYSQMERAYNFHIYLLIFYKNINLSLSEWRMSLLSDGYASYTKNIIIPLINKGLSLGVEHLFFDALTLYKSDPQDIRFLAWSCPLVKELKINCNLQGCGAVGRGKRVVSRRLELLVRESQSVSGLHINVSEDDLVTREIISPMLKIRGDNITSLTIDATNFNEKIYAGTLIYVLEFCPNLRNLKIRVWLRNLLHSSFDDAKITNTIPKLLFLEELWIQEEGNDDCDDEGIIERWKILINLLLNLSPNLFTLSLSICQELSSIMNDIISQVSCLHIRINCGFEWQPNLKDLYKFISKQKKLKHLFLEDITGKNFWKVRHHFSTTSLTVHWGTLSGWPRS